MLELLIAFLLGGGATTAVWFLLAGAFNTLTGKGWAGFVSDLKWAPMTFLLGGGYLAFDAWMGW